MAATRDTGRGGPPRPAGGRGARFEHVPALDGIRATALLAVMAYHGGLNADVPGGLFSLDAFFCLSGFLITSLLIAEWHRTGTIGLRAFWARRARRLLPALLLLLIGIAVWSAEYAGPGQGGPLRLDELSTLFYVANWHFIAIGSNYFAQNGPHSPLLHTWSLAVEEQFYLVWPVLAVAVLRWSRTLWPLLAVAAAGACASALEMGLLFQPASQTSATRVYFGSDTHAQSLLIGATLAVGLALWRQRAARRVAAAGTTGDWDGMAGAAPSGATDTPAAERPLDTLPTAVGTPDAAHEPGAVGRRARLLLGALALAGAAVTAYLWTQVGQANPFSFEGGVALASVAVAAVIAATMLHPRNPVAVVLSWAPLRFLGRISYGLYLWHYPFDLWLDHANTGLFGIPLLLVRTAVTLVVAVASYYLVEQPIRQGRLFTGVRAWTLGPATVVATVAVVLFGTITPAVAVSTSGITPWGPTPTGPPVRVLVVGDSVALTLGIDMYEQEQHEDLDIKDEALLGCGVALGNEIELQGQDYEVAGAGNPGTGGAGTCRVTDLGPGGELWPAFWQQQIAKFHPQLVVLVAGRWETVNRLSPSGQWTNILDPSYAAYLKRALELAVVVATGQGAHMVIETSPCFDTGEQPDGQPWPEDALARVQAYNQLVDQVAAAHPATVTVQNLYALVCPGGVFTQVQDGVPIRQADGVHFTYQSEPNAGVVLGPELLPLWYQLGHAVAVADQARHP